MRQLLIFLLALNMFLPTSGYADAREEPYFPESDRVLRVREVKGDVWMRVSTKDDWEDVYENMPLTEGYKLLTGEGGFIDVEVDSETFIRLAEGSEIILRKVRNGSVNIRYISGSVYASRLSESGYRAIIFDLGPLGRLDFRGQGAIRIDEDRAGSLAVAVREGKVDLMKYDKEFTIGEGEMARLGEGIRISRAYGKDSWDAFNEKRDNEVFALARRGYIDEAVPGRYDIERYGEWIVVPAYGHVWRPYVVVSGWAPFLYGRWVFFSPFGWTWVSLEPWGWITYHYGNWVPTSHHGWVWVPSRGYKVWYPARAKIFLERKRVRWVPLHPGERVIGFQTLRIDKKYGRIINRNTIFSRPVGIKTRKVLVVKEYRPVLKNNKKRRLIHRKRIEQDRTITRDRSRSRIDTDRRGDLHENKSDSRDRPKIGKNRAIEKVNHISGGGKPERSKKRGKR
jgi:hypothetical protein